MASNIYVLGGYQTDFATHWSRQGREIADGLKEALDGGLASAQLEASDLETIHVGNFAAELFCGQGHLGGLVAAAHPDLAGVPASRYEGACASSSLAILAATAELEAGRYGLAAVIGIEQMRNVPGDEAAKFIGGTAMWAGHECLGVRYPWPHIFSELAAEYDHRYGIKREHLARIAEINFTNARSNPNAQTRGWTLGPHNFSTDDQANPIIDGRMRRHDCGQVSDGAAIIFLANEPIARKYAKKRGISMQNLARVAGWGHRTAPITYASKITASSHDPYIFPLVHKTIQDAFRRANIEGVSSLDGIETHDCFTSTQYMAIDHFGITAPGQSWHAIEGGDIEKTGRIPMNPSGGLIGLGHPVGATGARMVLDCFKQVTGIAGSYQIENAQRFATLNIGGSATTTVSFVIERAQ